jgi:hypothetical protein
MNSVVEPPKIKAHHAGCTLGAGLFIHGGYGI